MMLNLAFEMILSLRFILTFDIFAICEINDEKKKKDLNQHPLVYVLDYYVSECINDASSHYSMPSWQWFGS